MSVQADNSTDASYETLFEDTLRRISVRAFDALLTCGVRDTHGFLQLKREDLQRAGITPHVVAELMGSKEEFDKQIKQRRRESNGNDVHVDIPVRERRIEMPLSRCLLPSNDSCTPIPDDLLRVLTTRKREVLVRKQVSLELLLELIDFYETQFVYRKRRNESPFKQPSEFRHKEVWDLVKTGPLKLIDLHRLREKISGKYPDLRGDIHRRELVKQTNSPSNQVPSSKPGTPIPRDLIRLLNPGPRSVLNRMRVSTCEQLLELRKEDLIGIDRAFAIAVGDIQGLQYSVAQRYPDLVKTVKRRIQSHAGWSLLHRTLPELFQVDKSLLPGNEFITSVEPPTIGCLDISPSDMEQLRAIALFPEDPIETLFLVSIGYLLQARVSENTLVTILEYLSKVSCLPGQSPTAFDIGRVSDTTIFSDTPIRMIEDMRVPIAKGMVTGDDGVVAGTWREIADLSERSIIEKLGFRMNGLRAIKHVWELKKLAPVFVQEMSKGLPAEAYNCFEELIDAFVQTVAKNDRECVVLKGRLGLLDGRKWTLDELGRSQQVTRERIRQIEQKRMTLLRSPKVIDRLKRLWITVDDILSIGGGVCCASEVAECLGKRWGWTVLPSDEALATLLSLSPKYRIIWAPPIRILMPDHQCTKCKSIGPFLIQTTNCGHDGMIPLTTAVEEMRQYCRSQCHLGVAPVPSFSKGFLYYVDDAEEEILSDKDTVFTRQAWAIHHGRLSSVIEAILLQAGRAMHFLEILDEIRRRRPDENFTEHNVFSHVGRLSNLLLWDRGTYIHRSLVNIPDDLIAQIELDILERLQNDVPYISVSRVFDKYEQPLMLAGIPSESALYTCLRNNESQKLSYPEYPYVMSRDKGEARTPLSLVLAEYVNNYGGIIPRQAIRDYVVEEMCVSEQLLSLYLGNMPGLLRVNRDEFIHVSQLNIQIDDIESVAAHVEKILTTTRLVSVGKIFEDKRVTCKMLGISTPMLLHSVLEQFCGERFDVAHFPNIRRIRDRNLAAKRPSIAIEIVGHIRDKQAPCSISELYDHFVDKLGYSQAHVSNVR